MAPFVILLLLLSLPVAQACARPEKIFEFPGFMGAVFAIFILPQAISLMRFPGAAPAEAVTRVLWMACLCLGACLLGYQQGTKAPAAARPVLLIDHRRLFRAGLVFVGCGLIFTRLLGRIQIETSELGGWTGAATIYAFFQQLCYPGFAICLVCALRRPRLPAFGALILASLVPLQSIFYGRREAAALFLLTIGLTLFFQKNIRPPRWLVGVTLLFSMLVIPATGTYRKLQLDQDWLGVRQLDFGENFHEFLNGESPLELRNAAMLIEATRRAGRLELGAGYWNHLVFRYVPGQWFGMGFKESLMLPGSQAALETELSAMGYTNPPGSTVTGIGDVYAQFGYGGCLFFAALGLAFRLLWTAANAGKPAGAPGGLALGGLGRSATGLAWGLEQRIGSASLPRGVRPLEFASLPRRLPEFLDGRALFAQLLYIQSCTSAMRAVTHWTLDFLPGFLYGAIFLGAAFWYARQKTTSRKVQATPRRGSVQGSRIAARCPYQPNGGYLPKALATMKIKIAPPNPPPNNKYNKE